MSSSYKAFEAGTALDVPSLGAGLSQSDLPIVARQVVCVEFKQRALLIIQAAFSDCMLFDLNCLSFFATLTLAYID